MFAVKGWNVDASALKPQTEVYKKPAPLNEDGEQKASRKRKRENAESAKETAQKDKVGQLWEEHVEGKQPKSKNDLKKERKRQKLAQEEGKKDVAPAKTKPEGAKVDTQEKQADTGAEEKSKKAKKNKNKDRKERQNGHRENSDEKKESNTTQNAAPAKPPPVPAGAKLTPMQAKMREKLTSARFRHLNETLYTAPSEKALEMFDKNPEMFEDYHSGFRQQVTTWPENPVDNFIATIRARGKVRLQSQKKAFKSKKRPSSGPEETEGGSEKLAALPRTHGTAIIADLGCGDARLAQTLKDSGDGQKLQLKVLSYDLHSPSPLVTKADISSIPTADGSVDIAIFCLALMGTNWISFIEEAYRILHWKGELWVAEIKSRFGRVGRAGKPVEHSVGGKRKLAAMKKAQEKKAQEQEEVNEQDALAVAVDGVETKSQETDVSAFVDVLRRRGFVLKDGESSIDLGNKMFVKMEFIKAAQPIKGKNKPEESAKDVVGEKKKGFVKKESWKKSKFLDEDNKDDVATDDEAKTLKPCLYKIR